MGVPQTNNGEGQEPVSQQIPDYLKDYIELDDGDNGDGDGTPDPTEPKPTEEPKPVKKSTEKSVEGKEPGTEPKPDGEGQEHQRTHKPGWLKKIERQRARISQLESQLAEMKKSPVKPVQKLTRDHFLSDDEYEGWKDQQRTEQIKRDLRIENTESQISQMASEVDDEEFRGTWQERLQDNFSGDQQGLADYTAKLRALPNEYLRPEIHEMLRYSEVGPRMLHVLASFPEIANRMNSIKSTVVLGSQLAQLERQVQDRLSSIRTQPQAAPAPQSARKPAAPPPTGPVGGQHSAPGNQDDEDAMYVDLMNKKFGRRSR